MARKRDDIGRHHTRADASHVRVVHAVPGRVRVKVHGLRGDESAGRRLEDRLSDLRGVRRAQANPVTGSVLIHLDAGTKWADVLPEIAEAFRIAAPSADAGQLAARLAETREDAAQPRSVTAHDVKGFFGDVNEAVRSTTDGLDLKLLLPAVLVLLGVRGLVTEGGAAPRWYDFLWFGFGTFMMLNAAGVPTARAAEEAAEIASGV